MATILCTVILTSALGACAKPESEHAGAPAIALTGRVTDAAGVISPAVEARLTRELAAYERRTRHQMVVVTTRSLGGRSIAVFTRDLGNAWGIGRKGHDDGVVVLLAPAERSVRIEVGKGLEATLTDERAFKVIHNVMVPQFKAGHFDLGMEQGVSAIIGQLDEGEVAGRQPKPKVH